MATLTTHPPPTQRTLLDPRPPSRATLDDLLTGSWRALQITHGGSCLLCGGELAPHFGSGPHPVAATCRSCGTHSS
jgi:hypothetical protein